MTFHIDLPLTFHTDLPRPSIRYSGEELDDVKDASCHLYDGSSYRDLASFKMANCAFLDKHTALVVGMFFRDLRTGEWAFEIISEAAQVLLIASDCFWLLLIASDCFWLLLVASDCF